MQSDELKGHVKSLIREFMVEEGVENYDIHHEGKSEIGDNYSGEIIFLKVVPKDKREPYSLVVKTSKWDEGLDKWMPIDMVYDREVFMYSKVFPAFKQLIKDTNSGLLFDFIPKVYSLSDVKTKQTIIFENLKSKQFKLHDRKKPWNLEHSLMAMQKYGEFHALSLALKDQRPEKFKELTKQMTNIGKEFNKVMDVKAFAAPSLENVMKLLKNNGRDELVKKYEGFIDEIQGIMSHEIEKDDDKIVIAHADCWNNNFMFQYQGEDESKPTSMCLLDFQLSQSSSPVKDLSYNIYSTCDKRGLNQFDELLKTYHDSLSGCLRKLGSNPDDLFTLDQLKEHWKKYGKFGVVTALMVLKICLVEKEDVPDFIAITKDSKNVEEFNKALNVKVKDSDEYDKRVFDVFVHFGENFL